MHRRRYLGLAAVIAAGMAGCAARAIPGTDPPAESGESGRCPAVLEVDRTICPADDGPLTIEQSSETVSGDGWSLVVTVTNASADPIGVNPYAWSVYRQNGDRWRHAAPDASVEPRIQLAPDDRYVWQLTAGAGGLVDADHRVFLDVAPGTYAFAVPFRAERHLGAVVTFDVTG